MTDLVDQARTWSAVADAWDAHVEDIDEHSIPATGALIDRIAVQPGEHVLELAAGPGSLGATWSQLVGPTGTVVLSDIAPRMVDVAARRNASLSNVSTAIIDATAIDLPDDSVDVVVCRMGLMFAPDPAAALAEIHRVLVADGRFGALTWAGIEHNPWMTCVGMAAMMNGLTAGGPPIGPGGIFSLGDPDRLAELATAAQFRDVTVEAFAMSFRAASVDEHIDRVTSLAGPLAGAIAAATPEQQQAFRTTARDLAAAYVTADGVDIPGRILLLTARR